MTRGNLKTLIRLYVPAAKTNRISDATLNLIIQQAVDDICARVHPIKEDSKFDITSGTYEYILNDEITRFLAIMESGLWWNAGSAASTDWTRLDAVTVDWLDKNSPNWRDLETGNPLYYAQDGDKLLVIPVPDTSLTDGLWLWFSQKPQRMGNDSHYPFGYSTQIERLAVLDDAIIKFCEWKLNHAVGAPKQESIATFQEYIALLRDKSIIVNTRIDISANEDVKFQGKKW